MDFDTWLAQAWDAHATDPAATAARLPAGLALAGSDAQLAQLARLGHHLHGEHLAQWGPGQPGRSWQEGLRAHPHAVADGATAAAVPVYLAALALSAGDDAASLAGLPASSRIRATAMAAANLALHDTPRALALFNAAQRLADAAALPPGDPSTRAMAVTANNLASTLEEKATRSADERALMILAAQTARRCWAQAGGWLETERAEYRLAMTWLAAGDAAQAQQHARACLAIVDANGAPALERFRGNEALALAAQAGGDSATHGVAVEHATVAYAALSAADQGWCHATLVKLQSPQPGRSQAIEEPDDLSIGQAVSQSAVQ